jgi:hypothetical protein
VPGDPVPITGSHFTGAVNVTFDNLDAAYTVDSDSQVTATVPVGATTGYIAVDTPDGAAVSADKFTVGNADFSLTTTPDSQIVTAGASTTDTISVWPNSSLTGNVTLSVSGLPAGATAAFTPVSTSSSSTLTVQTGHKSTGNSTLTITGRNSSFTHTVTVTLQVLK